jgi:hypothetical protein
MIPRPVEILDEVGHLYPDAWKIIDLCRSGRGEKLPDWPQWCFCPAAAACEIVALKAGTRDLMRHIEVMPHIAYISALAAWRVTKGIYHFDKTLQDALVSTPLEGDIPHQVLFRLPEWCVYIETPGVMYIDSQLFGFFAHLESDAKTGRIELRLLTDTAKGLFPIPLHLGAWSLTESVQRYFDECYKCGMPQDVLHVETSRNMAGLVSPLVSLLLYLCSQNAEIGDGSRAPHNPEPKKTKRGTRIFQADQPTVWDVGVRIGAAIRRAQESEREPSQAEPGHHATPRPHIRRSHWHSFWTGPRAQADMRKIELKWLPPIPVNLEDLDGLPATVRRVKA